MIVYLALIIPIIITLGFYVYYRHKITWWEFFIPFGVTLILIISAKLTINAVSSRYTEYIGSSIIEIYEEEPYNEWVTQICTREYPCGTDSHGNTQYCTETYDCSHQEDYGPKWYAITDIGQTIDISERDYYRILKKWNCKKEIIDIKDNYCPRCRCYYSDGTKFDDESVGDISYFYKTIWKYNDSTRESCTQTQTYVNKIKSSDLSVFNIKVVDEKIADSIGLFEYPELCNELRYPTILGDKPNAQIQELYRNLNGKYGPRNKIRLWVLIFKDKDQNIAELQENYWVRGNKNEFVVCIGIDKTRTIKWSHIFSWGLNETLPIETRTYINSLNVLNDINYINIYNFLDLNLRGFKKRSFEEFDYLTVEPSKISIIIIYVISLLSSIGCCLYIIKNEYE